MAMVRRKHITHWQKYQIWVEHGGVCALCGSPVPFGPGLDFDHTVPLSLDGADDVTNLRPAHGPCNRRRKEKRRNRFEGVVGRPTEGTKRTVVLDDEDHSLLVDVGEGSFTAGVVKLVDRERARRRLPAKARRARKRRSRDE